MTTTVLYYDSTATCIVREHTYSTRTAADRAMRRAAKRHQIAAIAGRRTSTDAPTCHH